MQATVLYGPRDIRFEDRDAPTIMKPTDAVIRLAATCVCGSDLWPYRGINPVSAPTPMGMSIAASSRRWAARSDRSSRDSSSSGLSSLPTTPALQHAAELSVDI